ncbi:MAG: hypothetical protein ACI9EW_001837 [Cellvibrionaceae bacterium]|jgi:hypothetical protein
MNKKFRVLTILVLLATFLTAAITFADTTSTQPNPTALAKDYRQDDGSFDEDEAMFIDEDGVTWYLHDDGWYYDVPAGEFTGWEEWEDSDDFQEFEDDDDWEFSNEDEEGEESEYEDMSEEELAAREASTTGKEPAAAGSHPWQVALVERGEPDAYYGQFCGGSLIARDWILTAAHCVEDSHASEIDIVIGRDVLSSNTGERIAAKQIIIYAAYTSGRDENADIALIKLSRPATKGQIVAIANNTTTGHLDDAGINVTISGWGLLNETDEDVPDRLHEADTEIVSNSVCNITYDGEINNSVLCAGEKEGGKDSCQGDSGGPLVTHENGTPVQVGVVSWGDGCGLAGNYGVYTRVAAFQDWLSSNMKA